MESESSYRAYRSSDLYSVPPTSVTMKKGHVANDGVGWSGFAFLVAVGIAIGGASLAAMNVVKPDAPPKATSAMIVSSPEPQPMPPVVVDPPAAPQQPVVVAPPEAPKPAAPIKSATRSTRPRTAKPKTTPKGDAVPTNPYDGAQVDRTLPPLT